MIKKNKIIAVDFGATFIKLAVVGLKGRVLQKTSFPTTDYKTRQGLLSEIIRQIRILISGYEDSMLGVGVGVPGQVDFDKGLIFNLTNVPGWRRVPLKDILSARLKLPVYVDNDANCACLGEAEWGAVAGCKDVVCITLGSGVGGGIMINGEIYRGRGYSAGEVGHICIDRHGPRCNCGGTGCVEAFAGNRYVVSDFIYRMKNKKSPIVLELVKGDLSKITPKILQQAARKGDKLAIKIWQEFSFHIGIALVSIVNMLNPEIIVIGGGLSRGGELIFPHIRKTVNARAIKIFTKGLKVKRAKFIDEAGIVGAAALVKKELKGECKK